MSRNNILKLKALFITTFVSVVVLTFVTKDTYAFLNDDAHTKENSFASVTLDLVLESDSEGFSITEDLLPNKVSERKVTVKNDGSIPFVYSLEASNFSDDTSFCQVLDLKVTYKKSETEDILKYEGLLKDFIYNDDALDPDLKLLPTESADYLFELTIPNDAEATFSDNNCGFDIQSKAWMEGYLFQQAYWDDEALTNSIASADWLLNMGFETAETLLDEEDENPELGFCPVITIDHSQDGDEALEIIKWDANENAVKYTITPYTKDGDNWDVGTPFDLVAGDAGFTINGDVAEYETSAPVGIYAYLIEAFDADENLIGATTPRETGFTCTFTVLDIPEGSVVINEIMWGGSSEHELDTWIELRNTTNEEIDLTGWKLDGSGPSFHELELEGVIPANGYYLITHFEPDHDQPNEKAAILDSIEADLVDDALHLAQNGEQLTLKDVLDNEIDKTPMAGPNPTPGWAAGEEGSNASGSTDKWRSMERNDTPGDGTLAGSWHTCVDDRCNDENFWDDEGDDYGTPKAPNYSENDPTDEDEDDEDEDEEEPQEVEEQNAVLTTLTTEVVEEPTEVIEETPAILEEEPTEEIVEEEPADEQPSEEPAPEESAPEQTEEVDSGGGETGEI